MMKNYFLAISLLFFFTACETEVKKKEIDTSCINEYEQHSKIVSDYKIRMEGLVQAEGCKVIPIYASIIESEEFDILDKVDESPKLIRNLIELFEINEQFSSVIMKNSTLKKILLTNGLNDDFIEKFTYLVEKKLDKKEMRKIEEDNDYLNYMLLAAVYGKDQKDSKQLYSELKSSILIQLMPSFILVHSAIGDKYEFKLLLENFRNLQRKLSLDAVKSLAIYPKYFAYFLYPDKEDLGIDSISSSKLREVQESMQEKVIYIYREMFKKYRYAHGMNEMMYSLLTVEYMYPYLLEQHSMSQDDFSQLFYKLIEKNYILTLFLEDKCSQSTQEGFAVFGQNNMLSAIKLLKEEKYLTRTLFDEIQGSDYGIMSLFYVANLYNNLNKEEWKIFQELLESLPDNSYNSKIAFIQRIEKAGYFRNIVQQSDYKEIIDGDYGEKNPKYKYVLLTPYPTQNSKTLFDITLSTNISDDLLQRYLVDLIKKNNDELETHEFTTSEKFFGNIDRLDTVITVASIGLAPFTGGVSLAYVAKGVAVKIGTKKGVKYLSKKIGIQSRKLLNKGINQTRKGRKLVDSQIGIQQRNNIGNRMEVVEDTILIVSIGKSANLFFNSNLETKTLCQE